MREADARMAKFSRRGVILHLAAYLLCVAIGDMQQVAPLSVVVLTAGIIFFSLIRGYYLFRFESLYSCAPARWRNRYFYATLLGAIWWSVIMVSCTLEVGVSSEVPLLWMYTIVFFSTTVHAFAPFIRFCQVYQVIALVPVALAVTLHGEFEAYMYGLVMTVFVLLLTYQSQQVSENYWERLEANYLLHQRAKKLESQYQDNQASINLSNDFINNLGQELRTSLNDILGGLSLLRGSHISNEQGELLTLVEKASERQLALVTNVMDFSRILNKQLALEPQCFDLRDKLEAWVSELAMEADQQQVEIVYRQGALPRRAKADIKRLNQVLYSTLESAIHFCSQSKLKINCTFDYNSDDHGELQLHLRDGEQSAAATANTITLDAAGYTDTTSPASSLWLAICKGLIECMGGKIRISEEAGLRYHYYLRLPLQVMDRQEAKLLPESKFKNHRLLLVMNHEALDKQLLNTLTDWGVVAEAVTI